MSARFWCAASLAEIIKAECWPQAQLRHVLFPLGPLTKSTVRRLAAAAGLVTQGRKDSQGICFLGKVCARAPCQLRYASPGMLVALHYGQDARCLSRWLQTSRLAVPACRSAIASSWRSTSASGPAPSSTRTRAQCWATTADSGSTPLGSARG